MADFDDKDCLHRYRALMRVRPELFANPPDALVKIVSDPAEIDAARRQEIERRARQALPADDVRIGVLAADHYLGCLLRDAVQFSDGRLGVYNRVVTGAGGVVLPLLPDGIALIRIFRHALRRWFLEAPGGSFEDGADPRDEVRREMREEIGADASELFELGTVSTSPGLTSETLQLFAARVGRVGHPELAEGIAEIRVIPYGAVSGMILGGDINDGPTIAAITRAQLKGLF
jgi:ADP-ribose pyrophosphatase